jgi:RNA recognition motif-containing protein
MSDVNAKDFDSNEEVKVDIKSRGANTYKLQIPAKIIPASIEMNTNINKSKTSNYDKKSKHAHETSVGTTQRENSKSRRRVARTKDGKKLSNESQREAWDHYLQHRPLRDEKKDQALGFDLDERGEIIRDPITGKPSSSCCGKTWFEYGSIRKVGFHEFSDLGPGLGLTFRFMQVIAWGFLIAGLLAVVGWIVQIANPKNHIWVTIAWSTDMFFIVCFTIWMFWLRRDMVLHDDTIDKKDITASDYAVQLYNLPPDATADEVAAYCSQFGEIYSAKLPIPENMYDNDFDRTGVSIVRNDSEFISAAYKLIEIIEAIHATAPEDAEKVLLLAKKKEKIQEKYNMLRRKKYQCTGMAFVCFMYQDGAEACRRGLRMGNFMYRKVQRRQSYHYLQGYDILGSQNSGGSGKETGEKIKNSKGLNHKPRVLQRTTKLFRNKIKLSGEVAPNPSDILWKNLANSKCNIMTRQLIIGTLSFGYLFLLSLIMAFFAAHAREYQNPKTHPPFNLGLLAVLGNVLCCLTSIVLLMPIVSTFEGVHSRSTLEIITFLKLGFFQTMGVVVGTIYVYSLDEEAANMKAFSSQQILHLGSGLPTYNCSIPRFRFNMSDSNERPIPRGWEDVYNLDPESCYAFTLHLFGTGMGGYLIGTLIADIVLINMIDFLCPPWWVETMKAVSNAFQIDLNKAYEGVDYKPFLRYQILLKFLFTAMFLSHIDNPRIMYFWVAACFWQSLEIDRYCYVLRYRKPPLYSNHMIRCVILYCLPVALLIHGGMHFFFFGINWNWTLKDGLIGELIENQGWIEILLAVYCIIFLILWFSNIRMWRFGVHHEQADGVIHQGNRQSMTAVELNQTAVDLDYQRALIIHNKPPQPVDRPIKSQGKMLPPMPNHPPTTDESIYDYSYFSFVEVKKYIPDPTRREFGVLKLN